MVENIHDKAAERYLNVLLDETDSDEAATVRHLRLVRDGLSLSVIEDWLNGNLVHESVLFDLIITQRGLNDRKAAGLKRLTPFETDTAIRIARLMAAALSKIDNNEDAIRLLNAPSPVLGGQVPLRLMDTQSGYEYVYALLENNELCSKESL